VSFEETLTKMQKHGQSVMLTWGEDTEAWECSWITGGKRYTAFDRYPAMAAIKAERAGREGKP